MNTSILNTEIQEFINHNINSEITSLLLKKTSFSSEDLKIIIEQIEAKKRCKTKLPSWYSASNIYYPNKLNIEQTSSEPTAKYKAGIIEGHSIIDLTGGFGVDCFYFSKVFQSVIHCEINASLSKLVQHNFQQLQADIQTINTDGIGYLKENNTCFDWIYIDPSRRHDSKGKVFFLNDCLPNVPEHIDLLFSKSKNVLIKTSPLLDLSVGINELTSVKTIHVVAVNNEVKELLWRLERNFEGEVQIKTVNLKKDGPIHFDFLMTDEKKSEIVYSSPLSYLYEPNAAILKAGGFNMVSEQLNLSKLHKHSHLYTSDILIDFPGRRFKIESVIPFNKKAIKKLGITKANITTRHFPESVQQLRKKLNIKDGGEDFLFFTTDKDNNKLVLITKKA